MSETSNPNGKLFSVLAYFGILWLVGLLAAKDDTFVKFHVNQGLVLFLFNIVLGIVMVIPIIGWIVGIVGSIFSFVCFIMGIVNACKGQMKPLPLVGKIQLIK